MDKYYTPTIEEFHIGFEYYRIGLDKERYMSKGIIHYREVYGVNTPRIHKIVEGIDDGSIVAKYLDEEDIESLGFEFEREFSGERYYIGKNKCKYLEEVYLSTRGGNEIEIHNDVPFEDRFTIFFGKVKNKSELKVILKQIGYGK